VAITIPSDLPLLNPNDLLGHIPTGQDPLHTLMRRTNWHYATHAPPLCNVTPIHQVQPTGTAPVFKFRVFPSRDGLTYNGEWALWINGSGTVDLDVQEGTTWGGGFTSVGSYPVTQAVTGGAINRFTFDTPIASSTRYLEISCTNYAAGTIGAQIFNFCAYPKKLSTITSGKKTSGFIAYDDAALTATSAPIHEEYFTRGAENVRATQADRKQNIWSYVQDPTSGFYRWVGTTYEVVGRLAIAPFYFGMTAPTDVTVYCRANDTGTPDGDIRVGQIGSFYEPVVFTADDTDRSGTLTLDPQSPPMVYMEGINPGTGIEVRYCMIEWTPSLGTEPILGSVAPPPLREYLAALDGLTLDACINPYAQTGLNFNAQLSGGPTNAWSWGQVIPPACYGMRPYVTMSRNNGATNPIVGELTTQTSGSGTWDQIWIECPIGGSEVYPPNKEAVLVYGGDAWIPSPASNNDRYRLAELTQDREPQWEEMDGRRYCGFSGETLQVPRASLSSLP
jgi:hypothetical protein